ncbi:MAG TPA: matrixin family metalloprotease [Polyangiaceae bacterium]|nr:matrixin family metalloprotease [Polyangiaceae bacterium]
MQRMEAIALGTTRKHRLTVPRLRSASRGLFCAGALAVLAACGGHPGGRGTEGQGTGQAPTMSLDDVSREVGPGDRGGDVAAVYSYLRTYGYLPNPDLEKAYPYWMPLVSRDATDPSVFGPEIEQAVRIYQGYIGVTQSGRVDRATLDFMKRPRCPHPENEFAALSSGDKWNLQLSKNNVWNKTNLTWTISAVCTPQPCVASLSDVATPFRTAFASWQAETTLTFQQVIPAKGQTSVTADYDIRFYSPGTPPTGWPAIPSTASADTAFRTSGTQRMGFNQTVTWTADRLQRDALHEIGHSLGLAHTGMKQSAHVTDGVLDIPVMFASEPVSPVATIDDRSAIIAVSDPNTGTTYTNWNQLNGLAVDIGVGGSSPTSPYVWVTSGSNSIWGLSGGVFYQVAGDGVSIAVSDTGVPWAVTSTNTVMRRTTNSVFDGTWQSLGGAIDVGVGSHDPTTNLDYAWIISNVSSGDGNFWIQQWNGEAFVNPSAPGSGVRITVQGSTPWVTRVDGTIWSFGNGTWVQVTNGCATDIAAGLLGGVYVIGCPSFGEGDFPIFSFESNPSGAGLGDAQFEATWLLMSGGADRIAVGPDGRPYAVQASGAIFRRDP